MEGWLDKIYSSSYARARLRVAPLGRYLDTHAEFLVRQGYPTETIQTHFVTLRRLNAWLAIQRIPAHRLDESVIEAFANELSLQYKTTHQCEPLRLLLRHLRATGVNSTSAPRPPNTAVERQVKSYIQFLRDVRGLSEESILCYALYFRRFLSRNCAGSRTPLSRLRPKDVVDFVRQLPRGKGSRLPKAVTALRTLFRYLHFTGRTKEDLSVHVPAAARTVQSLPVPLTLEEVRLVLRQCNRRTSRGRRDYAVLLLLSRLGLRSGEVRRLKLDDFDWRQGEVTIHGKGRRLAVLPLPADVGRAVSAYVMRGRPACASRYLFIRDRAPHVEWSDASAVHTLVQRRFREAGFQRSRLGPHVFRHTLATRLLRRGRSLEEIGQVLRHTHVNSTATYARVNVPELRSAAGSWPGGGDE